MGWIRRWFLVCFVLTALLGVMTSVSRATDPVEDLQRQIDELAKLKQLSVDATKPLEKELSTLESRIKTARDGIAQAKKQSAALAKDIEEREKDLAVQYQILSRRVTEQYKRSRLATPLMTFLSS